MAITAVSEALTRGGAGSVELEDGTLIFAPIDEDWVIRKQLNAKA